MASATLLKPYGAELGVLGRRKAAYSALQHQNSPEGSPDETQIQLSLSQPSLSDKPEATMDGHDQDSSDQKQAEENSLGRVSSSEPKPERPASERRTRARRGTMR